jgi:hypothetical protein
VLTNLWNAIVQVYEADLALHRAIRKHFQLKDTDEIDFEMFDHLVRKIVKLAHSFTGMETIATVTEEQADMLLEHKWPTGVVAIGAQAKKDMIKAMLGKKVKKDIEHIWVSPFGSHFPNPRKKSSYHFYHDSYCPESGAYVEKEEESSDSSEVRK